MYLTKSTCTFYTNHTAHLCEKIVLVFALISISYLGSPTLSAGVHWQSPDNLNINPEDKQNVSLTILYQEIKYYEHFKKERNSILNVSH